MGRPKAGLVTQRLNREVLIYDPRSRRAFCLNPTAALVWERCDGTRTVAEIVAETELDDASVRGALLQLEDENLLESRSSSRLSRRSLLAAASTPFLTALALPRASSASCTPDKGQCGQPGDCNGLECNENCGICFPVGGCL